MNVQRCNVKPKIEAGRRKRCLARWVLLFGAVLPFGVQASFDGKAKVDAGLGYDSNIYRSPSSSYMDNSLTTPVLVSPSVESGWFFPVALGARGELGFSAQQNLYVEYLFDGIRYLDSQHSNADQHESTLTLGTRYFLKPNSRFEYFDVGVELSDQKRLYLERDFGTNKASSAGIDVSSRYTYSSVGLLATYKQEKGNLDYRLDAKLYDKDYVDAIYISQMDHQLLELSADVEYKFSKAWSGSGGYSHQSYDYVERPSRDAQGALSAVNPALKYRIVSYTLGANHRYSKKLRLDAEYGYSIRSDLYVNYNDYVKQSYKISARYAINDGMNVRLFAMRWWRDYPNAFAFDEPGQQAKAYDGYMWSAQVNRDVNDYLQWSGELRYQDENSTDLRYVYQRTQMVVAATVKW